VKHEVKDIKESDNNYVSCINDKRIEKDLKKKFEKKYNVKLMERVEVKLNQASDKGFSAAKGGLL
jgi:hypothetical protein